MEQEGHSPETQRPHRSDEPARTPSAPSASQGHELVDLPSMLATHGTIDQASTPLDAFQKAAARGTEINREVQAAQNLTRVKLDEDDVTILESRSTSRPQSETAFGHCLPQSDSEMLEAGGSNVAARPSVNLGPQISEVGANQGGIPNHDMADMFLCLYFDDQADVYDPFAFFYLSNLTTRDSLFRKTQREVDRERGPGYQIEAVKVRRADGEIFCLPAGPKIRKLRIEPSGPKDMWQKVMKTLLEYGAGEEGLRGQVELRKE